MKCCICFEDSDPYFLCEITNRTTCERCEKETIHTKWGPKTAHPCYVKETHEHVRVPRLKEINDESKKTL